MKNQNCYKNCLPLHTFYISVCRNLTQLNYNNLL